MPIYLVKGIDPNQLVSLIGILRTFAFLNKYLQTLTRSEFLQDVATQAGADFIPKGTVSIAIEKATLLDKSHHTYSLAVSAKGSLIFHLTQARLYDLSTQIAGKGLSQAQKHLLQLQGVQGVCIKA